MNNLPAASTGRARAAEQSAQKSADSARQLATAFLGISSMAETLNSWLVSETAASGDGQGMCFAVALTLVLIDVCLNRVMLWLYFTYISQRVLCHFLNPSSTIRNLCNPFTKRLDPQKPQWSAGVGSASAGVRFSHLRRCSRQNV